MVGICGVLGHAEHDVDRMADDLRWTGAEETAAYGDEHVAVRTIVHPGAGEGAASPRGDVHVWVWGNVWGFDGPDGYESRHVEDGESVAAFCARRYADHGIEFVDGLNGTFAATIYDPAERTAYVITDRLGTHPIYATRARSGAFVFSTLIQSVPTHPGVGTGFEIDYLGEYFVLGSVGGTKTPFTGVEELPPSSVTAVDLDTGAAETERYWTPRFDPIDAPFSAFADRFVDRFEAVLEERLDPDRSYGLLLSGGSDSRAILAGVDADVDLRTYHASGWPNRERAVAEQLATVADREFGLLERDRDTHEQLLDRVPSMMNFHGRFCEAHIADFTDRLRDEVDVLLSGLGADTLFRDHAFPVPNIRLGPFGTVEIPIARRTRSVDAFVRRRAKPLPAYLDSPHGLDEILHRNITETADGFSHHGIACRTIDELVFFDDFYPFSNKSDLFYHALNWMTPHWSPFFDNRLVDLALRLPLKHRSRRSLVNTTTTRLAPDLAKIRHALSGVPPATPFPIDFIQSHANQLRWKYLSSNDPPESHQTHGPWINSRELIRSHGFVERTLDERAELFDAFPFLDRDGARQCYENHLDGADNHFELYTLLSFLEMPVTERLASEERYVAAREFD
jgi:asparagine synthase (glutamine-hydrolysing)